MKANELMISDWVYRPDCYDQVKEISNNGIIGLDSLRGRIMFGELKPISLTREILEKNGFQQISTNKYISSEITIAIFAEEFLITIKSENARVMFNLKYVHELQHALRLAGIDKTIEL